MTKTEVLQGALALNGDDKKYSVSINGDKIVIQVKYRATLARIGTFHFVAHLNDDNTYTESQSDNDGRHMQFGKQIKMKKTISFTFESGARSVEIEEEDFNTEEIKKVLRDYLGSCGYKRKHKGFFDRLFRK